MDAARKSRILDDLLDLADAAAVAVLAFVCLFTFVLSDVTVVGESMESTLFSGDRLVCRRFFYTPERGDVVTVCSDSMQEVIIKRIIGEPNDTVEIDYRENTVSVNGERLDEPYVRETMTNRGAFAEAFREEGDKYIYKVPFGKYLVLGDNRNHSTDGRVFGFITRDEIVGKAVFRYYSRTGKGSIGSIS